MMWTSLLRGVLAIAATGFALGAQPAIAQEIGADGARHLLNRTGFAASPAEIDTFAKLTREQAVDRLLRQVTTTAQTPPPRWVDEPIIPFYKLRSMSQEERMREQRLNIERGFELREWWFREMLNGPSPLTEKMTLFWHNHFATSQQKVRYGQLMYRQNVTLRRHALGSFGAMLKDVARDPAMVIYLDSVQNRRGQPNENFAREVMELFTVGEGQYSEQDIKEVARAFTGWSLDRDTGEFMFRRMLHDGGPKRVLGRDGPFDGDAVLDILLQQPQTAEFITRKLWREFVSPTPEDEEVHRLARLFRNSRYDVKTLMRAMLTSDSFYAPQNRAVLIKSPVEFVVGTLKQFDIETRTLRPFVLASALLGQNPMSPPNVKGWPGGEAWINSSTLLGRKQLIDRLFRADDRMELMVARFDDRAEDVQARAGREARMQRMMQRGLMGEAGGIRFDLERWVGQFKGPERDVAITRAVLAMPPHKTPKTGDPVELVKQLVTDATYQLK
jgi:uncharacterized protein (DUF1800 family)